MIDEELESLYEWLQDGASFELPDFKSLPNVPLYMDQVITYVNRSLSPWLPEGEASLTSFMVNNYVKAKIIREPDKKKYNEEHLGYLLAISFLKRTLSMSEMSQLIQMDQDVSDEKSALYSFFRSMLGDVAKHISENATFHLEDIEATYEKLVNEDPEYAKQMVCDSLGVQALRFAIKASVYSLLATKFLSSIGSISGSDDFSAAKAKSKREIKREEKNALHEAERVAVAVEKGQKRKRAEELRRTQELSSVVIPPETSDEPAKKPAGKTSPKTGKKSKKPGKTGSKNGKKSKQ